MSSITRFVPKNHLSYLAGLLVHLKLPSFLNKWIIAIFAKAYHINLDEAELSYEQYPSLGEFFIRKLKPGLRPVGNTWAVHPADSVITQAAPIHQGKLIQAKGRHYSVESFTQDKNGLTKYDNGHFLTYYLCPTDYHRVHSPVSGEIKRVLHIPGALWPVNAWSTENIHELFSINERVVVEIQTDRGLVAAVFVGATNVGKIELSFDKEIIGNQLTAQTVREKQYQNLKIQKGEELGMFRMGSTVVMLYAPGTINPADLAQFQNKAVKVNSDFVN
ncbi:MAG: phosphatidylserine decarboxylase proenzyme [Pseudobdellovibrio sp.]|jgi:phosphatidylserine decarboxylase|nr:phosphatidylserine decarboxylase proenzyme [Pseudobdellovibrio sp.]